MCRAQRLLTTLPDCRGLQERQECCGWNEIEQFKAIKTIFLKSAWKSRCSSSGVSVILRITLSPRRSISQQSLGIRGFCRYWCSPDSDLLGALNPHWEILLSDLGQGGHLVGAVPHGTWKSGTQHLLGFPSGRKVKIFGAALFPVCDNL